jgi:hypothetical protein
MLLFRRLLTDPRSPMFEAAPAGALWDDVERAIIALGDDVVPAY